MGFLLSQTFQILSFKLPSRSFKLHATIFRHQLAHLLILNDVILIECDLRNVAKRSEDILEKRETETAK